jgi:PAS domain S-box-containing protein
MIPMRAIKGFRRALSGFSQQLAIALALVALAASGLASLPALTTIRSGLDEQLQLQLQGAEQTAKALLLADIQQMDMLTEVFAGRPTLLRLIGQGESPDLDAYLAQLLSPSGMSWLAVQDARATTVASAGSSALPLTEMPSGSFGPQVVFIDGRLALVSARLITAPAEPGPLGRLMVGRWLDDEFASRLASNGGFEVGIYVLSAEAVSTSPQPGAASHGSITWMAASTGLRSAGGQAAAADSLSLASFPLDQLVQSPPVNVEVSIDSTWLRQLERRSLLTLVLNTLGVATLGIIAGLIYAGRISRPLSQLTVAAKDMADGSLAAPVPKISGPSEVRSLARVLEGSRLSLLQSVEDLRRAKSWSENLIQSIGEGVITYDAGGRVTFFSQGAERILGRSEVDVVGKSLDEVLPAADDRKRSISDSLSAASGRIRLRVYSGDGRDLALEMTHSRLGPPGVPGMQQALVIRDVSEEAAVHNLRSYFLANISHEFRTPLSALAASIELMMDESQALTVEEMGELVNSIHMSTLGLQTLVDNLLESTTIEAGKFVIRPRQTNLKQVIDNAARMMSPLMKRRQQRLVIAKPLPEMSLVGDPSRLTQVFVNLLSNASKYSPLGENVEIEVKRDDDRLTVMIRDRGPGISRVDRDLLFHRFVRLGVQDESQYGIGLGLWVTKAIVEGHGGQVGVRSRQGGGSEFWFTLPCSQEGT